MADDITYFDPFQERRVDGLDAMKALLVPLTGQVRIHRYEMLDPKVQHDGEIAVLTFNLLSCVRNPGRRKSGKRAGTPPRCTGGLAEAGRSSIHTGH
jgi:hypothetical protein